MNFFTSPQETVLFHINKLRENDHTPTRAEIEEVVDKAVLIAMEYRGDVAFDTSGNLTYAPYPRR
jgi:hypothetical protein